MLRLRGSPFVFTLLFACASRSDPEPLASYGSERLQVMRSTDLQGTPIIYAYLFPASGEGCPPLAPVRAHIDGRTLAVNSGGGRGTCFGASFKAPLVVLRHDTDFHEVSIVDDSAQIRARVADLRTDARLVAIQDGDVVSLTFDRFVRGHIADARVTWSGTVAGDVTIDGATIAAPIPREVDTPGRIVVAADLVVDLEVASCEGIDDCQASWFVHEVLDLAVTR